MSEKTEEIEFEIEGLTHLAMGFSIMASSAKSKVDIDWYESQLRNYNYLLQKTKGKLEQEILNEIDFNAS